LDGASRLPIAGWVVNEGGGDITPCGANIVPPKLGWVGRVGIMGAMGGEIGAGDKGGSAIV